MNWNPRYPSRRTNDPEEVRARLESGGRYEVEDVFPYITVCEGVYTDAMIEAGMPKQVVRVGSRRVLAVTDEALLLQPTFNSPLESLDFSTVDLQTRAGAMSLIQALSDMFDSIDNEELAFSSKPDESINTLRSVENLKTRLSDAVLSFLKKRDQEHFDTLSSVLELSDLFRDPRQDLIDGLNREYERVSEQVQLAYKTRFIDKIKTSDTRSALLGLAQKMITEG